jgi:hypothetical protein
VHDQSAATDPTTVPASCQIGSAQPAPPPAQRAELQELLTHAGLQANAHNFARTFTATLWYAAGTLVAVFLGLLALPRRARPQDTDAGLPVAERASPQ